MAQIDDSKKLFEHELGMALGAERKVLATLKKLEKNAQREELKQQFHHHLEETEGQIENIEQAMQTIGAEGGREIIRGILALDPRLSAYPPDSRMIEEECLTDDLKQIRPRIATREMGELMRQDRLQLACAESSDDSDWQ